jgi:hypothetical protein
MTYSLLLKEASNLSKHWQCKICACPKLMLASAGLMAEELQDGAHLPAEWAAEQSL